MIQKVVMREPEGESAGNGRQNKGTRAQGQGQAEPTGRVPTKATKPTQQHRASLMIPARWPKPRLENMSSSLKLRQ